MVSHLCPRRTCRRTQRNPSPAVRASPHIRPRLRRPRRRFNRACCRSSSSCSSAAAARRSSTKSSGSSCSSSSSARRPSRWACCSARSWAACVSAACCSARARLAARASAARVRVPRARHRRDRPARALRDAASSAALYSAWAGTAWSASCCAASSAAHLPASADAAHGRDAARRSRAGWKTTPEGVSWLGFFYGGNTAGAVVGCLVAGFYLLRVYDMATTTYVGRRARTSIVASLALLAVDRDAVRGAGDAAEPRRARVSAARARAGLYVAIALSGMTALGAEVIWTRLLVAGARRDDVHVLADPRGVPRRARASAAASARRSRARSKRPRLALGVCQICSCACIAWAAYVAHRLAAVLAGRTRTLARSRVPVPDRSRALPLGRAAGRDPLGRELPARARSVASTDEDPGAHGRQRLRREHARRIIGSLVAQPRAHGVARHAALAAGAHRRSPAISALAHARAVLATSEAARRRAAWSWRPPSAARCVSCSSVHPGAAAAGRLRPLFGDRDRTVTTTSSTSARA